MAKDIYQENGYEDRDDYFGDLSRAYGVPLYAVYSIADILGPEEEFDMLPLEVDNYSGMFRDSFSGY